MDDKPIPVTRDGKGTMIKDYSILDWADALDEERTEAIDAAVKYRQLRTRERRSRPLNMKMKAVIIPNDGTDECIAEEAADTITAITSMLEVIGIDERIRQEAQERVNRKNREMGRI